MWKEVTVA